MLPLKADVAERLLKNQDSVAKNIVAYARSLKKQEAEIKTIKEEEKEAAKKAKLQQKKIKRIVSDSRVTATLEDSVALDDDKEATVGITSKKSQVEAKHSFFYDDIVHIQTDYTDLIDIFSHNPELDLDVPDLTKNPGKPLLFLSPKYI